MIRLLVLALFLSLAVGAQTTSTGVAQRVTSATFAQLSAYPNGTIRYCSNCAQASPCAAGGSGALAVRRAGAWDCSGGGGLPAGCLMAAGVLTCTAGFAAGDGSRRSAWEMAELSANGLNKTIVYGPAAINADSCVTWPSDEAGPGQVLGDLGTTSAVEGRVCRNLGWVSASVAGCAAVGGVLTCPGGYASGDGSAQSKWEMAELSANGSNKTILYGPASIASDHCGIWPNQEPTAGQVLTATSSTLTVEGLACRLLSWITPATGGGGVAFSQSWACRLQPGSGASCEFAYEPTAMDGSPQSVFNRTGSDGAKTVQRLIGIYLLTGASGTKTTLNFTAPIDMTSLELTVSLLSTDAVTPLTVTAFPSCSADGGALQDFSTGQALPTVTPVASNRRFVVRGPVNLTCAAGGLVSVRIDTSASNHAYLGHQVRVF